MSLQSALVRIRAARESADGTPAAHLDIAGRIENNLEVFRPRLIEHIRREPSVRARIDEACWKWIEKGSWPAMNPELATFVWDRLYEADIFGG